MKSPIRIPKFGFGKSARVFKSEIGVRGERRISESAIPGSPEWRKIRNFSHLSLPAVANSTVRSTEFAYDPRPEQNEQNALTCINIIIQYTVWRFTQFDGSILRLRRVLRHGDRSAYLMSSKISGWSRSRCNIRSFIACMIDMALSSAPCLELFSAAPVRAKRKTNEMSVGRADNQKQRYATSTVNVNSLNFTQKHYLLKS